MKDRNPTGYRNAVSSLSPALAFHAEGMNGYARIATRVQCEYPTTISMDCGGTTTLWLRCWKTTAENF
jgi:hypothetical protein